MRELRVEDALLYLDQVKVEFGDRPHIYNEFLEIMKTFKTQQIDTPGVIRRVSNLFKGNRRLVLGFNTFLPEGYQIEIPSDGDGPPVAVYRAPGSSVAQVLRESAESQAHGMGGQSNPMFQQQQAQGHPPMPPPHAQQQSMRPPPHGHPPPHMRHPPPPPPHGRMQQQQPGAEAYNQNQMPMQHSQQPPQGMPGRAQHPMDQRPPLQQQQHAGYRPPPPQQSQQAAMPPVRDGKIPAGGPRPAPHISSGPPPQHPASMNGQGGARQGNGMSGPVAAGYNKDPSVAHPMPEQAPGQQGGPPLEFDHAINYVTTIKKRFASAPETYKKFLEILHTYQKEQRGIKEVLEEVSTLFADHPDLLKEFTYFLPDAVQAQAKAQLEAVAKESEARKRAQAKQAIMSTAQGMQQQAKSAARSRQADLDRNTVHIPFGAMQGRSEEQESAIIRGTHFGTVSFAPVRPPRRNELSPAQAAAKKARPVAIPELPQQPATSETAFFQRIRDHLERRELQSERPSGSRRHTPYIEFLKSLHLFGAGIVNREELLLLVKSLLMHGHAPKSSISSSGTLNMHITSDANELLREMEEVLLGRGPYARQEAAFKNKSKYGSLRVRDFDFTNSENPTPSYFTYPSDYPHSLFMSNPGQTQTDTEVLKDVVVCVGTAPGKRKVPGIEDYDGVRMRHNSYEDMMFRIEDERFELDMAIERNVHALRQIEPFAEEVTALREAEEKDGQPIGRLQYRLNRYALNSTHINAIARIYGDRGDEVLQHLIRNPMVVLPIVYQRLKQKDVEWRKVKADLASKLEAATEANYEGSLDVVCYFNRRGVERRASPSRLRDDCIRAGTFSRHPEKLKDDHPAAAPFEPTLAMQHKDPLAVLFQPYVSVSCPFNTSHKDAFELVTQQIRSNATLSVLDRERIGRIWAEFVAPWFGYPPHWVMDEARVSFSGTLTPNVVKFAPGQRVVTIFGEGTITSFINRQGKTEAKYRIKLAYGIAFVGPTAILCALPSKDAPFVRRDGVMIRNESIIDEGMTTQVDEKYQLLFGTESIYMFLRLYAFLCSVISYTREHCATFPPSPDPALSYFNPYRKEGDGAASNTLSFAKVMRSLNKVLTKEMHLREFETLGRKLSKEKVHLLAALPKLIERCAIFLVKSAKEDALLHLYDYCNHRKVDPVVVRNHCFTVAPDAAYRIQYEQATGQLCFSYVPKDEDLLTAPSDDIMSYPEEEENGGAAMMEDDEDDPIEEYVDNGAQGGPPLKRKKLK